MKIFFEANCEEENCFDGDENLKMKNVFSELWFSSWKTFCECTHGVMKRVSTS